MARKIGLILFPGVEVQMGAGMSGSTARPVIIDAAEERCVPSFRGIRLSENNGARINSGAGVLLCAPPGQRSRG